MKGFIKALLLVVVCGIFAAVGTYGIINTKEIPMGIVQIDEMATIISADGESIVYPISLIAVDSDGEAWEMHSTKEHFLGEEIQVIWHRGDIAIKGE